MKKVILGIYLLAINLLLIACNNKNTIESINVNSQNKVENAIIKQIEDMTLDEKIGQMITVGIDGTEINEQIKNLIIDKKVGGIILFKNNITDNNQLLKFINNLKDTNSKNKVPLFICVDEEGGRVSRLPKEIKKLPSKQTIGKINDKDLAYKIGETIGYSLKSFGFNMDFAPVLDINSNDKNIVIGDRSLSSDKEIVSSLGINEIKGFKSSGVIPVAKHFPGHGDTSVDSHYGLPIIDKTLEELKLLELIPFKKAINEDVPCIMISHIMLSQIDDLNPCSMSKTLINDILRRDLNFDGVIVTDDMTMGAITNNYNINEACVKSINAGADLLLVCHGYDTEIDIINKIKNEVSKGNIPIERINESVYRILSLKQEYKISDEKIKEVDIESINSKYEEILKRVN